ncbi:MAG: acylphosphatase [Rhodospirillales bacterium]|nr:acylphosphatase [Rhodospirillales bacterium]
MTKPPEETVSVRAVVLGRVQGVWFRAWMIEQANRLGLSGWVRNRADGGVEAVFSGPKAKVEEMIAACWSGPSAARVENVAVEPCDPPGGAWFIQRASA